MKKLQNSLAVLFLGAFTLLSIGCGGTMILKPPAKEVKTVALVNVYAKRGVHKFSKGGGLAGLTSLASLAKGGKKKEDFGGAEFPNYAAAAFVDEFSKVKGWEVLNNKRVVANPSYKAFVSSSADLFYNDIEKVMTNTNFVTASNMAVLPKEGRDKRSQKALGELAKKMGVDAVAVLGMDITYDISSGIGGTGTAAANVGMSIIMIDQNGKVAGSTPLVVDKKTNSSYRQRSDNTVGMLAGAIIFNEKSSGIFKESIDKNIAMMLKHVTEDIKEMNK